MGFSEKEINPFYVSISQTYMDLKDFKNAIIYYKKELEHYIDNPAEVNLFIYTIQWTIFN